MEVIRILIGGLLGGGLIGFIEFMIRRNDEKNNRHSEILSAIRKLDAKIDAVEKKVDSVDRKGDERNAISNRIRILRFADELYDNKMHSKDSWDQVLSDTTEYNNYCSSNPEFKNNQTEATVEYIQKEYSKRLEKHDFTY